MNDLRDDLRALVARWRYIITQLGKSPSQLLLDQHVQAYTRAERRRLDVCADELDAILARQPSQHDAQVQRERDIYEMVQHNRPPSTPPMTREALEEAEQQEKQHGE